MQFVMQVGARGAARLLAAPPHEFGEEIVAFREVGVARRALVRMARLAAGIFAIISALRRRLLGPRGVDLARVVALSLVRVRQDVVGGRNLLELLLGALVARVEVRMQFLRQLPVGFADLLGRRGLGDAENIIGVSHMRLRTDRDRRRMLTRLAGQT